MRRTSFQGEEREFKYVGLFSSTKKKMSWKFGDVLKVFGNHHYLVNLDIERILKMDINQLGSKMLIPEKKATAEFQ